MNNLDNVGISYKQGIQNARNLIDGTLKDIYDFCREWNDMMTEDKNETQMWYCTPAGLFLNRKENDWKKPSGFTLLDIDNCKDSEEADRLKAIAAKIPYTVLAKRSVSNNLHIFAYRTNDDMPRFREDTVALQEYYAEQLGIPVGKEDEYDGAYIDGGVNDPPRACFLSLDTTIYYNNQAISFPAKNPVAVEGSIADNMKKAADALTLQDEKKPYVQASELKPMVNPIEPPEVGEETTMREILEQETIGGFQYVKGQRNNFIKSAIWKGFLNGINPLEIEMESWKFAKRNNPPDGDGVSYKEVKSAVEGAYNKLGRYKLDEMIKSSKKRIDSSYYKNAVMGINALDYDIRKDTLTADININGEPVDNTIAFSLAMDVEEAYKQFNLLFSLSKDRTMDALMFIATSNSYNSFINEIKDIKWDRVNRLDSLAETYFKIEDEFKRFMPLYNDILAVTVKAIVARNLRKDVTIFPYIPIFTSVEQGLGKSNFTKILALKDEWQTSSINLGAPEFEKRMTEAVVGCVVGEIAEVSTLWRSKVPILKDYITKGTSKHRPPYMRKSEVFPHRHVLIGTSNERAILQDETGNRRHVVIPVESVEEDLFRENIFQIYAEALEKIDPDLVAYSINPSLYGAQEASNKYFTAETSMSIWLKVSGLLDKEIIYNSNIDEALSQKNRGVRGLDLAKIRNELTNFHGYVAKNDILERKRDYLDNLLD